MRFLVRIGRRPGIADPEAATVLRALRDLGHIGVETVEIGRTLTLTLSGSDPEAGEQAVAAMCEQLLANPVIEDYSVELVEDP